MNAVSFPTETFDNDDDAPLTERAPAHSIARLIARSREDDTLTRTPSIDLLAISTGADAAAVERMRTLYANGNADEALVVAASIAPQAASTESADPFGGLILVTDDELDADIEAIDRAFTAELTELDEPFEFEVVDLGSLDSEVEELDSDFLELDPS